MLILAKFGVLRSKKTHQNTTRILILPTFATKNKRYTKHSVSEHLAMKRIQL